MRLDGSSTMQYREGAVAVAVAVARQGQHGGHVQMPLPMMLANSGNLDRLSHLHPAMMSTKVALLPLWPPIDPVATTLF